MVAGREDELNPLDAILGDWMNETFMILPIILEMVRMLMVTYLICSNW